MKPRLLPTLFLTSLLHGCVGPRLISFPYDPGGRSLNSPYAESNPKIAGRYIVFISDRRGSQDVYLYDTVTRYLIELPGLNAIDMVAESPAISENGRFIVFVGNREGQSDIYFYDRDTRQLRNLTQNLKADVRNPSISADGNIIAFQSSETGQWDIVFYNRFGQPLNQLNFPQ
ncbi:MAG: Tol biopolymer transporter periplasmic protein [Leptolyngbyaceae cyanobacterium HOT.MB2.61]|nr:Tol biopolymer transporter periplasmic protein [Leptolyngbyaceae cyanobacterium HOT.MB2.61]